MNRNIFSSIAVAAALVSGQAFATDVANWAPDSRSSDAYPSLVQAQGTVSRADVRSQAQAADEVVITVEHWTPDSREADAFPSLKQQPVAQAAASRAEVRAQVMGGAATRSLTFGREGA